MGHMLLLLLSTLLLHSQGTGANRSPGGTSYATNQPMRRVLGDADMTVVLQLSDLHVSAFADDPARTQDLETFAAELLPMWRPDAVAISGDLTDGKTQAGRGMQQEAEWKKYKKLWQKLAGAAGLPATAVLDLRGNHDVFDVVRGGPHDFFMSYSARSVTASSSCQEAARDLQQPPPVATTKAGSEPVLPDLADPVDPAKAGSGSASDPGGLAGGAGLAAGRAGQEQLPGSCSVRACQRVYIDEVWPRLGSYSSRRGSFPEAAIRATSPSPGGAVSDATAPASETLPSGPAAAATSQLPASGADKQLLVEEGETAVCPTLVMVGVDATPNPGLRGPTNFLGVAEPQLLHELEEALQQLHHSLQARGCPPAQLLAFGHYPLSTTAHIRWQPSRNGSTAPCTLASPAEGCPGATASPPGATASASDATASAPGKAPGGLLRSWLSSSQTAVQHQGPALSPRLSASATSVATLAVLLERYNVSGYLCGHLHDVFGTRLHRLHRARDGPSGTQRPYRYRYLAELELADWKLARSFRLLSFDRQAGMSFADLTYRRPGQGPSQPQLGSVDASRLVGGYVVLLTSPPDARYFPLHSESPLPSPLEEAPTLRVLLLPVDSAAASRLLPADSAAASSPLHSQPDDDAANHDPSERAAESAVQLGVIGLLYCDVGRGPKQLLGSFPLQRVPGSLRGLFEAPLRQDSLVHISGSCKGQVWVQAAVQEPPAMAGQPGNEAVGMQWVTEPKADVEVQKPVVADARPQLGQSQQEPVGRRSVSELRPVPASWLLPPQPAASQEPAGQWPVGFGERAVSERPVPLRLTLLEWLAVGVDWPVFGSWFFHAQWLLLVGFCIILPRFLVNKHVPHVPHLPHVSNNQYQLLSSDSREPTPETNISDSPSCSSATGGQQQLPGGFTQGSAGFRPLWRAAAVVLQLLQPLQGFARLSIQQPALWWSMLGFQLNVLLGTWALACVSTTAGGSQELAGSCSSGSQELAGSCPTCCHGLLTAHGVYLAAPHLGSWSWPLASSQDMLMISNVHMLTCIVPATLWMAAVASHWQQQLEQHQQHLQQHQQQRNVLAGSPAGVTSALTWRQAVALLPLLAMHVAVLRKFVVGYGPGSLLLSPAVGWVLPLGAIWLGCLARGLRQQQQQQLGSSKGC